MNKGGGNAFYEMGFDDWEQRTAKAEIVLEIKELVGDNDTLIAATGLTQQEYADLVDRGRTGDYDVEALERISARVEKATEALPVRARPQTFRRIRFRRGGGEKA